MPAWSCDRLIEAEVSSQIDAEKNKQSTGRSGYHPRRLDTRIGTIYLMVPKVRNGGCIRSFVTERKHSETTQIQVIREAFIKGVSTRKIEKLARKLGIENLSYNQLRALEDFINY
ncbi:MAG TPA: hypothetical protein GX717_09210 [Clostridiaceae bacterium]|nr:hypothetical protein [Clostridiaceae bacterium]